jgi:hypothetical protein
MRRPRGTARARCTGQRVRVAIEVREDCARFSTRTRKSRSKKRRAARRCHDTYGIITPSSLHFERHHSGVPEIDPSLHTLTIHGMVDRPLVFTVDELKRLPSVSRIHFLECSGNGSSEWRGGSGDSDVQRIHGLDQLQRVDRRAGGDAVARMRRSPGCHLGACGRRRREQARSQHPDEKADGRCDGRLRPERRTAAAGTGLSDSSVSSRLGGQRERQVAAAFESDERSGDEPRGNVESTPI